MRILHTADWHLGDRLGRIDRTDDLRRAVERVGNICKSEEVDVLLVAGDLFSELARPDDLRETIEHWQKVFRDFLTSGGTILTLTGNHDNENFCRTLAHAMNLASPANEGNGLLVESGRLYLATEPSLLRLKSRRNGVEVQFIMMPYPTPTRYFRNKALPKYNSPEEKNQLLTIAFRDELRDLRNHEKFQSRLPTVMAAHINVRTASLGHSLFRISEKEDVCFDAKEFGDNFTYVALGHVHKPQFLDGLTHVRYSGSIEKMDLGETKDSKSVVVLDLDQNGLKGDPRLLPMPSTPVYEVRIDDPERDLPALLENSSPSTRDLVNVHITYRAGRYSLDRILQEVEKIYPRWYARDWQQDGSLGPTLTVFPQAIQTKSFEESVREYIRSELVDTDEDCREVMERLETLFREDAS